MTTMSKSSRCQTRCAAAPGFALSSDNSQALAKAAETWFAATTECQREMISFVSMRLEKDGETTREMMGCKNLADVTAIHPAGWRRPCATTMPR